MPGISAMILTSGLKKIYKASWLLKMGISKIKMTKSFLGKRSTDIAMKI